MKAITRLIPRLAAVLLLGTTMFVSPARGGESPALPSVEIFDVGSSLIGLAFDGANIWVTDFFGNSVIKVRASDGVVLGS